MKEIVVFGSNKALEADLINSVSDEFLVTQVQSCENLAGSNRPVPAAAVICVGTGSDLEAVREAPQMPFIVMADAADADMIDRAVALGAKYYFVSPVPFSMLKTRLEGLVREVERSA